jgi:hypothetical protein
MPSGRAVPKPEQRAIRLSRFARGAGLRGILDLANPLMLGRVCSAFAAVRIRKSGDRNAADAPLAQSAERLHGKEKVYGSIP